MSTQAEYSDGDKLYGVDMDNVVEALSNDGVLTGWTLAENATPNMSVDVAAGTGFSGGVYNTTVSTTNVTISTAHATLDRLDIIVVNNAGTISAIAGTAAASPNPPDLPDTNICLAVIEVDATVTAIYNADIVSKRILVGGIQEEHINDGEVKTAKLEDNAVTDAKLNSAILNAHVADTSDPHGSTMAITVQVTTPKLYHTTGILIETPGDLNLNPSGKINAKDDLASRGSALQLYDGDPGSLMGEIYGSSNQLQISAESGVDIIIGGWTGDEIRIGAGSAGLYIHNTYLEAFVDFEPNSCGADLNIGGSGVRFNTLYAKNSLNTGSCDVAEWMAGDEDCVPGDVMVLEPSGGMITGCTKENDPNVVGVYSEAPAVEMGHKAHIIYGEFDKKEVKKSERAKQRAALKAFEKEVNAKFESNHVLVGLVGTVPTKTHGIIEIGDYLITSNEFGLARAVSAEDKAPLFVLGRALTSKMDLGRGSINLFIEPRILYHNPIGG